MDKSNRKKHHLITSYDKRHRLTGLLFTLPATVFIIIFVVYPVCYNIFISFTDASLIKQDINFVGITNYINLFCNKLFLKQLWNTCIWTFWSVLGQLVLGLIIALIISRPMRGGTALRSVLLIPYVVPAITLALVTRWMLNNEYGIISYWLQQGGWLENGQSILAMKSSAMWVVVLLNIWRSYPFPMLIYWAAIKGIDGGLYEAATVDGASKWHCFIYVTLPALKSTTIVLIVLRTIWTATYYDLIYMVTGGGPTGSTTTLPIMIYQTSFGKYQIGPGAAISMILGLLMFICIIYYVKNASVSDDD